MAFDIMYANCNEFNFMANLRWKIMVNGRFLLILPTIPMH